jgi:hypothetical protein
VGTRAWWTAVILLGTVASVVPSVAAGAGTLPYVRVGNDITIDTPAGSVIALVPVTLYSPSSAPVTLDYLTHNATGDDAVAGVDYAATSGSLTFAPGEVQKNVRVRILRNAIAAPYKVFHVLIVNVVGANVARSSGLVRIDDPETADLLNGSKALFDTQAPGKGKSYTATVTFALSAKLDHDVTANFSEVPMTALPGVDYVAKTGSITIRAGKVTATVSIKLLKRAPPYSVAHVMVLLSPLVGVPGQSSASAFIEISGRPPVP